MVRGIEIREICVDDLSGIYEKGKTFFKTKNPFLLDWNENNLADMIINDMSLSFIAKRKKETAGFVIGTKTDDSEAGLVWLFVDNHFKNRGIEERLIKSFIKKAEESGLSRITAYIDSYAEVTGLLEVNGFKEEKKFIRMQKNI